MTKATFFKSLIFVVFTLAVQAEAASNLDGLYQVQGSSSQNGEYTGQAWVYGNQVQRVVRWKTLQYQNKQVESIWTGTLQNQQMNFSLSLSNVLASYNDFAPSVQQLQTPVVISYALTSQAMNFVVQGEGNYQETWNRIGNASAQPLWVNLRTQVAGVGDTDTLFVKLARKLGMDQVLDWFAAQPQAAPYRQRPEFQQKMQYFVQDKTDADFYAKNPNVLRVTNKTVNPLSLAEALMRRNAYAPKLAAKAELLGQQTLTNNLNAAGLLEIAMVDAQGNRIGRGPEYDSALWTSMYGWSELMRYQVTHDPQAVQNYRRVLNGILTLLEITGDPKNFARTLAISPASENLGDGWVQGQGAFANLKWRQGGNNDMIKGIFITLALAHSVVGSQETALRARIQQDTQTLLGLTAVTERSFNLGMAHGLVALWNQDPAELGIYLNSTLNLENELGDASKVAVGFYAGGIADWSGIHLSMISEVDQILISRELQKTFTNTALHSRTAESEKAAESTLWEMQKIYKNAHRDFLTLVTYALSPQARQNSEFLQEAREALWTLRGFPAPRSIGGNATVDLTKVASWSLSAWPVTPWKALKTVRKLKDNLDFNSYAQGAYSYPPFETQGWSSNYMWKDAPFGIQYVSQGSIQFYSSDYLMTYWASRVSGLLSEQD